MGETHRHGRNVFRAYRNGCGILMRRERWCTCFIESLLATLRSQPRRDQFQKRRHRGQRGGAAANPLRRPSQLGPTAGDKKRWINVHFGLNQHRLVFSQSQYPEYCAAHLDEVNVHFGLNQHRVFVWVVRCTRLQTLPSIPRVQARRSRHVHLIFWV
jgi:hypothetical protein